MTNKSSILVQYDRVKIQVVATKPSLGFYNAAEIKQKLSVNSWKRIADPILHIELRRWADLVLIAPCSANTLAKLAGGLCDNLATSLLRALPPIATLPSIRDSEDTSKRGMQVWVFPAMNTFMYEHPLTAMHLKMVQDVLKYRVEGPI
ncbi:12643_t:CDS:2, partial [Acaulospora colombiana]